MQNNSCFGGYALPSADSVKCEGSGGVVGYAGREARHLCLHCYYFPHYVAMSAAFVSASANASQNSTFCGRDVNDAVVRCGG